MGALKADAGQGHWGSLQGGSGAQVTTADREPRVAMADPGTRVAMADREPRVAMADPGTREAMAYFFRVARASQGAPWPWS